MPKQTHYTFERRRFCQAYFNTNDVVKLRWKSGFVANGQMFLRHSPRRNRFGRMSPTWTCHGPVAARRFDWYDQPHEAIAALIEDTQRELEYALTPKAWVRNQEKKLKLAIKAWKQCTTPKSKSSPSPKPA